MKIQKNHIIVLVKQVPDIEKVKFNKETGKLDRSSAGVITNPFDLNALEAALEIKEKIGAIITTVSMGPLQAISTLKDTVARGADNAILLTGKEFAGADTLATSYALACAIKKLGSYNLIICGEKTIDGDTAQVGVEVAEHLGIPSVSYVEEIKDVSREKISVKSKISKHCYITEMSFPGLITVTKDLNTPRLPTLKDKLNARKRKIEIWSIEDLKGIVQTNSIGVLGSATWVAEVFTPSTGKRKAIRIEGSTEEIAERLFAILGNLGFLE
jgi:electron transfer flavoprotein beta subunit